VRKVAPASPAKKPPGYDTAILNSIELSTRFSFNKKRCDQGPQGRMCKAEPTDNGGIIECASNDAFVLHAFYVPKGTWVFRAARVLHGQE
jgi:hypothetical protein